MQDLMFADEPKEVADEYRDRCIDAVLNKIREIAPDIAIMEA